MDSVNYKYFIKVSLYNYNVKYGNYQITIELFVIENMACGH